jgi:alanyl aminopeptidase
MTKLARWAAAWLCALVLCTPSLAAAPPEMRLDGNVKPLAYDLALKLLPESPGFEGRVVIEVEIAQPTGFLWLNANGLQVQRATLAQGKRTVTAQVVEGNSHHVGFRFPRAIPAGRARLTIDYSGRYSTNETRGLFKQQERGDWYAFTQFEAINARRAVPCFDEPHWKTPWTVTLTVRREHVALANTRVASETPLPGGLKRVRFAPTPPLPSYLVAFSVGPFEVIDGGTAGMKQVPLRYIVPKGRGAETRFVREATPKVLSLVESYFGTPYPFDKLDSVVIPITVSFWAMENPGLITYRGPLMLSRPERENERFQQIYVSVAAHEIAHQWFGNLVTMQWWEDLWLKESFATWLARKVSREYEPKWDSYSFPESRRQQAFQIDRLASTRQIRQPVATRDDLGSAYDRITYDKGGAVLAMIETFVGQDKLREGVRRYMARHAWGTASASDFFTALGSADPDIARAFASFVTQPGLPVVDFELDCTDKPAVTLRQQRFLPAGGAAGEQRWLVPVCMRYDGQAGKEPFCTMLREREQRVDLPQAAQCPAWLLPNPTGSGYYLSRLGPRARAGLARVQLEAPEAAALMAEQSLLANSAGLAPAQLLQLATPLAADPRPEVLSAVANALNDLHPALFEGAQAAVARDWARQHLLPRARTIGWVPAREDSDTVRRLRNVLLPLATATAEDAALKREARQLAEAWLGGDRARLGATAGAVLRTAALDGDAAYYDALVAALRKADDGATRSEIYKTLGRLRDPVLLQRAFELALAPELDLRESSEIYWSAGEEPANAPALLAFVRSRIDVLAQRMPEEARARMPGWHRTLCSADERAQLAQLYGERMHRLSGGGRSLAQALETVDICVRARAHALAQ